ncbi:hypothetical protein BC332_10143 [Capsicum chinense]|nr:hypothetical protein BC332_10143 [Capsicum chinense]
MKTVEDYFMGGVACKTLVGVMRNVKIVRDDKTGKIVNIIGLENANDCASGAMIFNTVEFCVSALLSQAYVMVLLPNVSYCQLVDTVNNTELPNHRTQLA